MLRARGVAAFPPARDFGRPQPPGLLQAPRLARTGAHGSGHSRGRPGPVCAHEPGQSTTPGNSGGWGVRARLLRWVHRQRFIFEKPRGYVEILFRDDLVWRPRGGLGERGTSDHGFVHQRYPARSQQWRTEGGVLLREKQLRADDWSGSSGEVPEKRARFQTQGSPGFAGKLSIDMRRRGATRSRVVRFVQRRVRLAQPVEAALGNPTQANPTSRPRDDTWVRLARASGRRSTGGRCDAFRGSVAIHHRRGTCEVKDLMRRALTERRWSVDRLARLGTQGRAGVAKALLGE